MPQSEDFVASQDVAMQHGRQSVAHTVGEKQCTCATLSSAAVARFLFFDVHHKYQSCNSQTINTPAEGERTEYKLIQSMDTCGMLLLCVTPSEISYSHDHWEVILDLESAIYS